MQCPVFDWKRTDEPVTVVELAQLDTESFIYWRQRQAPEAHNGRLFFAVMIPLATPTDDDGSDGDE